MGALDANGIYLYDEEEPAAPGGLFSELLNKAQGSTSSAVGMLTARVAALEQAISQSAIVTSGIVTPENNWTIVDQQGMKIGGLAFVFVRATYTGPDIDVPDGTGNITNTPVATLQAAWSSAIGTPPISASHTGRVASYYLNSNTFTLSATAPPVNIGSGEDFTMAAVYPLA